MATLLIQHPDGSETEHLLSGELTVGRQQGCDLVLNDGGVSRRHARLWLQGGKVLVEDLASANGTFLDGERLTRPQALKPGSALTLGGYTLRLKGAPEEHQPLVNGAEAPPVPVAASSSRLRGLTGPWVNLIFPLQDRLVVGRWPPAHVMLDDVSVSRRHAELELTPRGAVLRDLGSANGTLLNGERVGPQEEVLLQPGDVLRFGVVEFAYESGEVPRGGRRRNRGRSLYDMEPLAGSAWGRLGAVLSLVAGLALLAAAAFLLVRWIQPAPPPSAPATVQAPEQLGQEEQIATLLEQCRAPFARWPEQPDWTAAESACQRVLSLDVLNPQAQEMQRRIFRERGAAESYARGQQALEQSRGQEALELLRQIPKDSVYYPLARGLALKARDRAQAEAASECGKHAQRERWQEALESCERYMRLACQQMKRSELEPPKGYTVVLQGRLRARQWRPENALYRNLLLARQRVLPAARPWRCPVDELLAESTPAAPPASP